MLDVREIIEDLDEEFLTDFLAFIEQEVAEIEATVAFLEIRPDDRVLLADLLGSLHNIKVNCRLVFMERLEAIVQQLESLVARYKFAYVPFTHEFGQILLLVVDEFKQACEDIVLRHQTDIVNLEMALNQINAVPFRTDGHAKVQDDMLASFAGEVNLFETQPEPVFPDQPTGRLGTIPKVAGDDDLEFFCTIGEYVDYRIQGWEGRSQCLLRLVLGMNTYLDEQIDSSALQAAVYLHDFGMGHYPDTMLYKEDKLNPVEAMLLQQHPVVAAGFLERMPGWTDSANFVRYHHEKYDGTGYPNGLVGKQIPLGSQLISIADTFWAMTHERSHRPLKKSLVRAANQIKRLSGKQFSPAAVTAFLRFLPDFVAPGMDTID